MSVDELVPLHSAEVTGRRPDLESLSDSDLLRAVAVPINDDPLRVSTKSGKLVDGNGRAYELNRRARLGAGIVSATTRIPVAEYTPDDSAFPDLQ